MTPARLLIPTVLAGALLAACNAELINRASPETSTRSPVWAAPRLFPVLPDCVRSSCWDCCALSVRDDSFGRMP